ncbi:hypothetical protein U9M48_017971 [Paspalum notatum var. saurae]|uniref:Uncharacterized protein n=1 Tax=Paspalum notatum var. saurae TaxID=547442 RepID=A0AAQ3T9U1_PASNO
MVGEDTARFYPSCGAGEGCHHNWFWSDLVAVMQEDKALPLRHGNKWKVQGQGACTRESSKHKETNLDWPDSSSCLDPSETPAKSVPSINKFSYA